MNAGELSALRADAEKCEQEFKRIRDAVRKYARTPDGKRMLDLVDAPVAFKLVNFPGDISPARLVKLLTKIDNYDPTP